MKRATLRLFSIAVVLSLLLPAGATASDLAVAKGQGRGGNPVVVDAPSAPAASTRPIKTPVDPNKTVRVIVQLEDAPLASYAGGVAGLRATKPSETGAAKLDVNTEDSQAYLTYLAEKQAAFREQLLEAAPDARVDYQYRVVLNGMAVKVRTDELDAIRTLPGVKAVQPEREYKLDMDASIPLIGLGTGTLGGTWTDSGLWATLGGHANAGTGLKIADIDTGLDFAHPCFDPTGYTYPSGFPKYDDKPGESLLVTPKAIVARAYFRKDDPPKYAATAADDIESGHGSHTAGTMACNYGIQTPYGGLRISGVAPRAYLMVYRLFYTSISGSQSAYTPELVAAIEDVVADGADVVNNSWGGTSLNTVDDLEIAAYSAAVDAGVVVVFSAGNSGPGAMTLGNPGLGDKFITAGASTTNRTFTTTLSTISATVVSGTGSIIFPIPVTVTNMIARSVTTATVTAPAIDLEVEGYADPGACPVADGGLGALPSSLVSGKIVVIRRGICALVDKVANAAAGGAVGVVLRNVPSGATTLPLINPVLPTAHVSLADGENIKAFLTTIKSKSGQAVFQIKGPAVPAYTDVADTIADFSSRGPTPDLRIKPDVMAPAVNILSAVSYGNKFDFYQGTSMAAPHVTGASALLKQLHPDWTPAQIKSALMTTAAEPSALGTSNPTQRGSGRLNLTAPNDPGLTFNMPSVSFGLMTVSSIATKTITAKDVSGATRTYTATAVASSGGFTPTVPVTLAVPANGTATFNVVLTAGATGDAYGKINLTDGTVTHTLHIPYWVRRVTSPGPGQVLLVDDSQGTGCVDRLGFYTQTLTNLSIPYAVQIINPSTGAIDFNQWRLYPKVIYFSGDAGCGGNLAGYPTSFRNYLAQGGKVLATGQDLAFWYNFVAEDSNQKLFFGGSYVQDSLFDVPYPPVPAVAGDSAYSTYLADQHYDILAPGNGAGNQGFVDEVKAAFYNDVDALPILYGAPVTNTMAYGHLGTRMSSEPTIERIKDEAPWTKLGYRTEFLSFGLEGVNNNTGFNTREDLAYRLLAWLDDTVTVQFNVGTAMIPYKASGPFVAVNFEAIASSSVVSKTGTVNFTNSILYYRWDFGDGTPIQVTTAPEVPHGYARMGFYQAYVEAVDSFGHKAVAGPVMVEVGNHVFLPIIMK